MKNKLVIIGASGHGKVVLDIAEKNGYKDIVFLDDSSTIDKCLSYPIVGKTNEVDKYLDCDFFVAIGNCDVRRNIQKKLEEKKANIVSLIHPSAIIGKNVNIGKGTVVMAGAIINPSTTIGKGCIINTGSTVDHDNVIADFVHISVGTHLAGTVEIGKCCFIGTGAIIINNINICENCIIGAGAVVVKNITISGTYIGVPARRIGG